VGALCAASLFENLESLLRQTLLYLPLKGGVLGDGLHLEHQVVDEPVVDVNHPVKRGGDFLAQGGVGNAWQRVGGTFKVARHLALELLACQPVLGRQVHNFHDLFQRGGVVPAQRLRPAARPAGLQPLRLPPLQRAAGLRRRWG
jgi:hypothetical protein